MEADFLRSLHQTRQLEAEMHDTLAAALKVQGRPAVACLPGRLHGMDGAFCTRQLCMCRLAWLRLNLIKQRLAAAPAVHPKGSGVAGSDQRRRVAAGLQGLDGTSGAAAFCQLQQRTRKVQAAAAAAAARLEQQRQQVAEMVAAAKVRGAARWPPAGRL